MKAGWAVLLTALLLAGCAVSPPAPKTTTATVARAITKPDVVLACRMLKASYCAYDVSTASYDAESHSARLNRCESRTELQLPPALSLAAAPRPYAYLTPAGTNAFLVMQTERNEIILAFRGTVGLGEGSGVGKDDPEFHAPNLGSWRGFCQKIGALRR